MPASLIHPPSTDTEMFVCPFCGDSPTRTVFSGDRFRVRECLNCRLAATTPRSYVRQSDYANNPSCATGYVAQEDLTRQYARKMLGQIQEHVSQGTLLDIGCSIGILVDEALTLGYDAQGIDRDGHAVGYGRSMGRPVSDSELETFAEGSFDIITLSHTLEHIPNPIDFLGECRRILAPGGCIAIVVPCHDSLLTRLIQKRWYGWMPAQHYFHYSKRSITALFRNAGLTTINVFQESMNHRPRLDKCLGLKGKAFSLASYALAVAGHLTGRGDQLVALACKPESTSK